VIKQILTSIALFVAVSVNAQIARQWVATHNGQGDFNDRYTCIIRDGIGNYYLGGSTVNPGTDRDFLVVKTDVLGNTIWAIQLDGSGQAADEVTGLALTPTGDLVATGISKGDNTSDDFWTIKMDFAGDTLWTRRYDYIGEYDQPNALAVDAEGNVVVTGLSDGDGGAGENDDYLTLKYDANGTLLWARRFNGFGDGIDRAVDIATNSAGQVFVTGRSDNGQNDDYVTICYTASGNQQWIKYDDRGDRDRATALTLDPSGNLLITGQSNNGDNDDFWILKYTPNGIPLWQKAYDFVDDDRALAIATDASGNVFVTGQSDQNFNATRNWDIATVGFSSNGNPLWVARYDGQESQDEFPTAIATDESGHVFVTGRGDNDPGTTIDNEIVTFQYQAFNGTEQWRAIYPGPINRDNGSTAINSDGNGGCVLVGYAEDSTAFRNALFVNYSNTGLQLWEKQFNGTGDNNDSVRHLGVDNAGNVYAAGFTVSNGDNRNLTLMHFNADGSYACRYVENGSAVSAYDDAQGLIMGNDESPIVMGYVKNSGSSNDIYLAKFNATCDTIWDKNVNGAANGSERAYDMISDGSGNLLLTGRSDQQAGPIANDVCYTLKMRESDGATIWVKKYEADTAATKSERGVVIKAQDANQVYVLGRAFNGLDYDVFLLKYDGNGNQLWAKPWTANLSNDIPVDMALDVSGNIYLLANTSPNVEDSVHDMVLLKYSTSGNLLWTVQYNYAANGNDEAVALSVDNNGDIIISGKVDTKPGPEVTYGIILIKYNPDGALTWVKNVNTPGDTDYVPDAMEVQANNQIYVAGHANMGTVAKPNFNVIAYIFDFNGHELWSDTYDGTAPDGSDIPNTILLKGNDFYIGGSTVQPGQQRDILVIKYSGTVLKTTTALETAIQIYPNPALGTLTFKGLPTDENMIMELYDATGRRLKIQSLSGSSIFNCPLSDLPSGMLLYRIFSGNNLLVAGKVYHSNQ